MTLGNLLSLDQIIPEMQALERWSAIVELVDLLVAKGQIRTEDRDVVLGALRARVVLHRVSVDATEKRGRAHGSPFPPDLARSTRDKASPLQARHAWR